MKVKLKHLLFSLLCGVECYTVLPQEGATWKLNSLVIYLYTECKTTDEGGKLKKKKKKKITPKQILYDIKKYFSWKILCSKKHAYLQYIHYTEQPNTL